MSWHARWGKPDPFAKPAKPGERFGVFAVVELVAPDPHYGLRAKVRCVACGFERVTVLARLRHARPKTHRGCTAREGGTPT